MKILSVGSVAFDSIKTPFGEAKNLLGGSATYFSLAARFFATPAIVAVVGQDFTDEHRQIFTKNDIDVSGLVKLPGKTFAWGGEYGFDLNTRQTLFTHLNVFENFKPQLHEEHQNAPFVFLGNIQPNLQKLVLNQIKHPKLVGLDTMNLWIQNTPTELAEVLKLIDVLVINDSEARQLSQEHNLAKAAKKIRLMMRPQAVLVIKQGEHGLLMFYNNTIFNLPGYLLEDVFDPTGAGDSFAGGFMGYLAQAGEITEANLKRACVFGSVVASFCVEDFGTKRLETLTKQDIDQRFAQFKQLTYFELH